MMDNKDKINPYKLALEEIVANSKLSFEKANSDFNTAKQSQVLVGYSKGVYEQALKQYRFVGALYDNAQANEHIQQMRGYNLE